MYEIRTEELPNTSLKRVKVWRIRGIAPLSLNFGTIAVSGQLHATSALPPPHPRGNVRYYPLQRRLGESECRSGRFGEEKSRMKPWYHWRPALRCHCDVATFFRLWRSGVPWSWRQLNGSYWPPNHTASMRNARLRDSPCGMIFYNCVAYLCVTAHLRYKLDRPSWIPS
jgi:hypothetical protein